MLMQKVFRKLSSKISVWAGSPIVFIGAVIVIVAWALSGKFFDYSDTWQLVINTGTTIVTFLMVFVLQNSQNRDGRALQAKIDELILTSQAQNKFIGIEKLDEEEIRQVSEALAEKAEELEEVAEEKSESR